VARINLGLDLGSTALRAAFAPPGEPVRSVALSPHEWSWLLCVRRPDGDDLPVRFLAAKAGLGVAPLGTVDGTLVDAAELITAGLRTIRSSVEREAGAAVGTTVISVPARFLSRQRTALLDAAKTAGLTDVRLVTDSMAAAIAHTGGERGGTVLAVGMGYGGVEVGLVRALRGRYRALDYDGATSPGGHSLDHLVLAQLVRVLCQSESRPDPAAWNESSWRRLRRSAQAMKEGLAAGERVFIPRPGTISAAEIDPATFAAVALRGPLERTVELAQGVLTRAGLGRSDVDSVLLFGGSTRIPLVSTMLTGLGGAVHFAPQECLATGALWYADLMGGGPGSDDHVTATVDSAADAVPDDPVPPMATRDVTAADVPALVLPTPGTSDPLTRARTLAEEGERDAAIGLLRTLVDRATALLAELESAPAVPVARPVADVLAPATALLAQGMHDQAVRASHRAWAEEPRRPDVFEAMLDIHVRAADAMSDGVLDQLVAACRWLHCAYSHDQSDSRLRGLLAEREYQRGRELLRLGRESDALTAVEKCFDLAPDHLQARDLLTKLRRTGRKRKP
jgi:hypothetical protein